MAKRSDALVLARNALDYASGWLTYRTWRTRIPGAQVAVMIGGELITNKGYGWADLESSERLGSAHQFRIASHSKWITATAIMRLVEDDAVRLDDTVGTYVHELSGTKVAELTLRELLSHGSGTTRDSEDSSFWSAERPFPDRAELIAIASDRPDIYAAGTAFKYSNIGYGLLGLVLESITGRSFDDVTRELVTRPLGLSKTVADVDDRKSAKPVTGYTGIVTSHARKPLPNPESASLRAATGFTSTAAELARFARAHVQGNDELLSDRAKALMRQPLWRYTDRAGRDVGYGLGTMVTSIGGREWIGHGGSWLGQSTRTIVEPALDIVITVLTNSIDGPAEEFAVGIAGLILASQERHTTPLTLSGAPSIPLGSGTSAV
ncbi:MAG TPA: beta-lactamase family protein, partial [Candidatus Agrococcus pullicola]|nr:beta-lactamase family protein [Candidatus Agrococcus pullicola]